jgi:methylenetetrahydrofolate reductase (NADPH)
LITQLFFDNNSFYEFKEKLYKYNIKVPVIAGIMPPLDKKLVERISKLSGASIPKKLKRIMEKYENSSEALAESGIVYATEQIADLILNEVNGIHLYSMNKVNVAKRILENIKEIRKEANRQKVS